jgi:hypothetical protein
VGWDRKKRGPAAGYFYKSVRVPGMLYPVKIYLGRGAAGHEAAAEVEKQRQARLAAKKTIKAELDATAEADRLAADLAAWADVLTSAWMTATGHHCHHGEWRLKRG